MPCKNEGNKKLWTCIGDDSAENDVNCTMSVKRMLTDSNASGSTNPRDCIWWAIDRSTMWTSKEVETIHKMYNLLRV